MVALHQDEASEEAERSLSDWLKIERNNIKTLWASGAEIEWNRFTRTYSILQIYQRTMNKQHGAPWLRPRASLMLLTKRGGGKKKSGNEDIFSLDTFTLIRPQEPRDWSPPQTRSVSSLDKANKNARGGKQEAR